MEVTIAMFGAETQVTAASDDGCAVRVGRDDVRLSRDGQTAVRCERPGARDNAPGPFTLGEVGATRRLAWPGGGMRVRARSTVAFWGERYAAVVDTESITIVDARADCQARIEAALFAMCGGALAHAGRLWIGGPQRVVLVELAALEASVAGSEREVTLDLQVTYPLRKSDSRVEARVAWVFEDGQALVNIGTKQVRLAVPGLERGTSILLCDELVPGTFARVEPDGRRSHPVTLVERAPASSLTARVVRGKSRDPLATAAAITTTDPRVEQLVADIAQDPENDANRLVLVDLLQQLGEAYGTWVAQGKAKRRDMLGPLALYLEDVEYRGGLPWSASVVRRAPDDREMIEAARGDVRLGLLSTLRAPKGPKTIYAQLVGSPRATGLRRVDVSDADVAAALIDGQRTQLTHVFDVRFTKPALVKLLADPTFDRVVEIDTVVQAQHLDGLLDRVRADTHGLFARAPRRLVVREQFHAEERIVVPLFARLPDLPVGELVLGPISVRRDGDALVPRIASEDPFWRRLLVEALPQLVER